jgi:hypothetical protein
MRRLSPFQKGALVSMGVGAVVMVAVVLILGGGLASVPVTVVFGAIIGFSTHVYVDRRAKDDRREWGPKDALAGPQNEEAGLRYPILCLTAPAETRRSLKHPMIMRTFSSLLAADQMTHSIARDDA